MANKFDWNALDHKIESTISEHDELDRTKALTAVAVSEIMEIDLDEAIDAITDGGNDRCVDAMYIDDRETNNEIHISQAK